MRDGTVRAIFDEALPWRGDSASADRPSGPPLPPARLPLLRAGRPLKRWRYVGAYGEDLMLCVGLARIAGVHQGWWAVWDRRQRALRERTVLRRPGRVVRLRAGGLDVSDGDVRIALTWDEQPGVETASRHGDGVIWTRKQGGVVVRGTVVAGGEARHVELPAIIDDTAGYHARHTAWRWSAGVGRSETGAAVAWNLVTGVHDGAQASERSVWIDGVAHEVAPVAFAADLASVTFAEGGALRFAAEARRERHDALGLLRSDYVQPFGMFSGTLPGAGALTEGFGVMEDHTARW